MNTIEIGDLFKCRNFRGIVIDKIGQFVFLDKMTKKQYDAKVKRRKG